MEKQKFSIAKRLNSFSYAFNGIKILLTGEYNARIHVLAAIAAIFLSSLLQISKFEWIAIIFAIGFVFSMELINTSLERLADQVSKLERQLIKQSKDLAAAGVLVSAIVAIATAAIIFIPRIISL